MVIDVSTPVRGIVDQVARMADGGLDTALITQVTGYYDALTTLAIAGREVPAIELMTSVAPIYPHHPIALATQALTVQAATGGRLALGIGTSHRFVVEGVFGYSYERPARRMREYLEVLVPLMAREQVAYRGETVSATTRQPLDVDAPAPPVLVAALGRRMLEVAGALAGGTITWMSGPAALASHIVPTIRAAAGRAGRPAPRVEVILPVCVTGEPDAAREQAEAAFAIYNNMPSYRAMLDIGGAATPADVAVIGDEDEVVAQLQELAAAGATDLAVLPYGSQADRDRTFALVSHLAKAAAR